MGDGISIPPELVYPTLGMNSIKRRSDKSGARSHMTARGSSGIGKGDSNRLSRLVALPALELAADWVGNQRIKNQAPR